MRRGVTLIEMLAATVLLVLIAGTCVPLFRRALDVAATCSQEAVIVVGGDLDVLADDFAEDPEALGVETFQDLQEVQLAWPDDPARPAVWLTVLRVIGEPEQADHVWLRFEDGDHCVFRWVAVEPPVEEPAP